MPRVTQLTDRPILVRMDSGFDSQPLKAETLRASAKRRAAGGARIDILVKWNPRAHGADKVVKAAQTNAELQWNHPREGKRVAVFSESILCNVDGTHEPLTRVYRVIERTIDRHGQQLLIPEWGVEGWDASLDVDNDVVIALYADHGTHEQFHSEFKTDLDLERLPSGKFDTNDTVLSLAVLAYNSLRLIGQNTLLAAGGPVRHPAKRRRLRTVMQEVMYLAATITEHARSMAARLCPPCPSLHGLSKIGRKLAYPTGVTPREREKSNLAIGQGTPVCVIPQTARTAVDGGPWLPLQRETVKIVSPSSPNRGTATVTAVKAAKHVVGLTDSDTW